ncbi:XAP5, circadian clock regulator-domain-containing protein [Neurospora tetraspora]|uniref:XAP5, circadian clock regulator-domain-containing protein n=1 Tax=Neurospora tetraspora TaxID=94610 RepID=A0AAE0J830_9PEZI|nr:XAP5, circadian clock regulator-domain-containing protein [Neurospora tetraspora]
MSDQQQPPESNSVSTPNPRFAPQNKTVQERVSSSTVGLVNLADFRKRRAEVLEQQHREVREAAIAAARGTGTANPKDSNTDTNSAATTPLLDRSATGTPAPGTGTDAENGNGTTTTGGEGKSEGETGKKKTTTTTGGERKAKRVKTRKALVSFGDEEEEGEEEVVVVKKKNLKAKIPVTEDAPPKTDGEGEDRKEDNAIENPTTRESSADADTSDVPKKKKLINTSAPIIPRALTKAALRREAAEREAIRKEFLAKQAAVKAAEIAIPFVFYDGTNIPGGMVRVKKGDHAWLFLDKSRKVGAERGVGQDKILNARRAWARVSVDDLLLVRGSIIIPHHYEFYFFIINKTMGPGNKRLFDYSDDAPLPSDPPTSTSTSSSTPDPTSAAAAAAISTPASRLAALPDIMTLEGANDDPTFTKVVDRRWYQRNKHIYPASTWQEFDPEKDYQNEIRRDLGGNAFFFSR